MNYRGICILPTLSRLIVFVILIGSLSPLGAQILLTSVPGNEGISVVTTEIDIDGLGNPSVTGDFLASGSISKSVAFNHGFSLTIDAVGLASNSGARVTDALIDRDGSGRLGVRGVNNGINQFEGFLIGLDAVDLEPGYAWQITGIEFEFINGDESFTIVNRNDTTRIITGSTNGMVDVSSLDLIALGGSSDFETAAVFANTTADPTVGFRIIGFELDVVQVSAGPNAPWRSVLYPEAWQPPANESFYQDKFIQDFSYAGYRRGETPVPLIQGPVFDVTSFGADPSGSADSTAAIQAAINAAGTAGGGVVSLPAGTFKVSHTGGSEVLRLADNGVVLRGSGSNQTFILNTTISMRNRAVIRIRSLNPTEGPPVSITSDITTPSKRLYLADVSSFAVGDQIEVLRDFTEAWILEHGQEAYWNPSIGVPEPASYRRVVTASNLGEGWIEVDIPMRYAVLTRDLARVQKLFGRISGSGIEDLSIGNVQHPGSDWGESDYLTPGTSAYDVAASWLIGVQRATDCWVKNVESFQPSGNTSTCHMLSNGIRILRSKNVTLENCHLQRPQYGGGGGNGYMYRLQESNDCLVLDCIAEFNRHGFVVSHSGTTGNVFSRCEDRTSNRATGSTGSYSTSGGDGSDNHMRFSHSNLWDQCRAVDSFYEAIFRTTISHGLSTAHGVYWNTSGSGTAYPDKLVATEQGRYGYVIGTSGTVDAVTTKDPSLHNTAPADHIEGVGLGKTLFPPSLYRDQLQRRLGAGVSLTSISPGSGASSIEASVKINGVGSVGTLSTDEFEVDGRSTGNVLSSAINLTFDAVKSIDLESASYGQKLLDGTIHRDSSGRIGVAGGTNALGTDGANREAIHLIVDAIGLDPSSKIQIETINLSWVNSGESCQVVNLQKSILAELIGSGATYPDVDFDVSGLGLVVEGGQTHTIAAIIPGPTSDLRVRGVSFSVTTSDGMNIRSTAAGTGNSVLDLAIGTASDGFGSTLNSGFTIEGTTQLAGAVNIGVSFDAMASVDSVNDIGAKLSDGTINADSAGRLGVNSGGIEEFEGIGFSLNTTGVGPEVKVQIAAVTVQFVNSDESFTIVNRNNPSKRLRIGGNASAPEITIGSGVQRINVEELDLSLTGGQTGPVATIFGNDMPTPETNFRLLGVQLIGRTSGDPIESFGIYGDQASVFLDWAVNPAFESVLLYRTERLGHPWTLLGFFPSDSGYEELIDNSIPAAFYRMEIPLQ